MDYQLEGNLPRFNYMTMRRQYVASLHIAVNTCHQIKTISSRGRMINVSPNSLNKRDYKPKRRLNWWSFWMRNTLGRLQAACKRLQANFKLRFNSKGRCRRDTSDLQKSSAQNYQGHL